MRRLALATTLLVVLTGCAPTAAPTASPTGPDTSPPTSLATGRPPTPAPARTAAPAASATTVVATPAPSDPPLLKIRWTDQTVTGIEPISAIVDVAHAGDVSVLIAEL